jgi:uncharacterized protein (DUF427 family)
MRAIWKGEVIAESDDTVVVEGNHHFPVGSVRREYLEPSDSHTWCHWTGEASYYSLRVGEATNGDAAWYYPDPSPAALEIKDHIAFWRGVQIEKGANPGRVADIPDDAACEVLPAETRFEARKP